MRSYLIDRRITNEKGSKSITYEYRLNSEPLLWNILCNSALHLDLANTTHVQAYADDFLVIGETITLRSYGLK